jgi:hypothetical protein
MAGSVSDGKVRKRAGGPGLRHLDGGLVCGRGEERKAGVEGWILRHGYSGLVIRQGAGRGVAWAGKLRPLRHCRKSREKLSPTRAEDAKAMQQVLRRISMRLTKMLPVAPSGRRSFPNERP